MDFFSAQEHARRTTRRLVLWFALAVAGLIASVYFAVSFVVQFSGSDYGEPVPPFWNPELLGLVTVSVGGFILIGSLYKVITLSRDGGSRIAEELGGRLVSRSTTDLRERRLINVVDEMAIASGIPSPPVYVLDAEGGINAFAAGARPAEAVVAVTRGTLETLSRDELQGVVAHEFSHIINGDMRLNLRLIGVLHGILLLTLVGRTLLRSARGSDRNGAPLVAAGVMLVVVGHIGVLCGKLIKAGVSRQREYLADASAVQFTRNPQGIAGALARIANIGSTIDHPRAEEASHMFFSSGSRLSSLLATHPPIDDRIRRIDPLFASRVARAETTSDEATQSPTSNASASFAGSVGAAVGTSTPDHLVQGQALIAGLPAALAEALRRPRGARATVLALLLSPQPDARQRQLTAIEARFGVDVAADCSELARSISDELEAGSRLPLLDLALPTLTEFSHEARTELIEVADELINADGRTSTFEYVSRRLLHATLLPERNTVLPSLATPSTLRSDTAHMLALLARAGDVDESTARSAFAAAMLVAPFEGNWRVEDFPAQISSAEFDRSLSHLAATKPLFRQKLVEACATAIMHDGQVAVQEMELLRAICQALDCPVPPLELPAYS